MMNRPNITNATVFPKLKGIIEEDINILKRMKLSTEEANYKEFIESLIFAKNKILKVIPRVDNGIEESPTPPEKLHIVGYKERESSDFSALFSALNEIEKEQMLFVRNAIVDEGMPNDLLKKLEKILKIYESITDQLDRSYKTKQYNSIVV